MRRWVGLPVWIAVSLAWTCAARGAVRLAIVVDTDDDQHARPAAIELAERQLGEFARADRAAAELIAVVRWPAGAPTPTGVDVVDRWTGAHLVDRPLPAGDDPAAGAIVAAVRAADAKRALPAGQVRTMCLLSVRNADLTREGDAFCREVADLLQRRLTDPADQVVLAPGRPGPTPTTGPATGRARITNVDLELAWAAGTDGVANANAILTDTAGRPIGTATVQVTKPDADALAGELATAIGRALRGVPPAPATDDAVRAEAERFRREATLSWEHTDPTAGLGAAEAALALTPDDPAARAAAARGRLAVAAARLFTVSDQGADVDAPDLFPRDRATPADVDRSLQLARSGADLLAPALAEMPDAIDATRLARGYLVTMGAWVYVGKANLIHGTLPTTPEQRAALDGVRGAFRRFRVGCQPAAAAAVTSLQGFDQYSEFLYALLGDSLFCFSRDPGEWADDVARLVPPYVELAKQFDDKPNPVRRTRHPMYPTGRAQVDPCGKLLYTLTDWWLPGTVGWGRVNMDRGARTMERQTFTDAERDRLAVAFTALGTDADAAFQKAANAGLAWAGKPGVVAPPMPGRPGVVRGPVVPQRAFRQPEQLSGAAPTVVTPPTVAEPPPPAPFWKRIDHLVEARRGGDGVQRLFCPIVVGPDVYVVAMVQQAANAPVSAQLWKLDPSGVNPPAVVGEDANPKAYQEFANGGEDPVRRVTADWPGTRAAISGNTYVFQCWSQRVVLFPLAGGPVRCVTPADVGQPGLYIQGTALLDATLFLALGRPGQDGMLVADRLDSGQFDTLAASRRREHLSPFDDMAPMVVSRMIADPAKHRVVFHATAASWPVGHGGLYAFEVAPAGPANGNGPPAPATTGTFRQLVPDLAPPSERRALVVSQHPTVPSQWLIDGCGQRYLYDLATDQRVALPSIMVAETEPWGGRVMDQQFPWAGGPAAVSGDWITREMDYEVQPHPHAAWGRINAKTGQRQEFPTLRKNARYEPGQDDNVELPCGCWPVYVADAGAGRVLVGDQVGLWAVTPPDDTTIQFDGSHPAPPPAAEAPPVGGQLPWASGRTLIDLSRPGAGESNFDFIEAPQARGSDVYAIALGHTGTGWGAAAKAFARLVCFPGTREARRDLGSFPVEVPSWSVSIPPAERTRNSYLPFARATAMGERELYVVASNGLLAMPLDGSAVRTLVTSADLRFAPAVCTLDGQVYVVAIGADGQAIVRCDPATGKWAAAVDDARPGHAGAGSLAPVQRAARPTTRGASRALMNYQQMLAAQNARRAEADAAYAAANRTEVPFIVADAARHRLLYVVQGSAPDPAADGLWAYDPATHQRQRVLPLRLSARGRRATPQSPGEMASYVRQVDTADDGTMLLATSGGLIGFDPRTDSARAIYEVDAAHSPMPPTTGPSADRNDLLAGRMVLFPPYAVGDGWLWSARAPLVRASLDGRSFQQMPSMRPSDRENRMLSTLQLFDGGHRLLAADHVGCWVLDLTR